MPDLLKPCSGSKFPEGTFCGTSFRGAFVPVTPIICLHGTDILDLALWQNDRRCRHVSKYWLARIVCARREDYGLNQIINTHTTICTLAFSKTCKRAHLAVKYYKLVRMLDVDTEPKLLEQTTFGLDHRVLEAAVKKPRTNQTVWDQLMRSIATHGILHVPHCAQIHDH